VARVDLEQTKIDFVLAGEAAASGETRGRAQRGGRAPGGKRAKAR
jgi:hypothetical protein